MVAAAVVRKSEVPMHTSSNNKKVDALRLPLTWEWLLLHQGLTPSVKITYAYIVSKTDPDTGSCSIPMETIGRDLGISYATIWKYINSLELEGYLRIERKTSDRNTYFPLHTWYK